MGGTPGSVPTDNIYEIMVEATDGTGHVGREAVMVEVTNVDEDGTVELSALQPAPRRSFHPLPLQISTTRARTQPRTSTVSQI